MVDVFYIFWTRGETKMSVRTFVSKSAVATCISALAGIVFLFAIHVVGNVVGISDLGAWFDDSGMHVLAWYVAF
jgi:hypothetical protein